jgi:hypothetical protein
MSTTVKEIVGGTPAEVIVKILLAAAASLWASLEMIGLSIFGYFILLVADAIMGAMLSKADFKVSKFTWGPMRKFLLTTLMLLAASVVETMIPGNFLFFGVVAFICATTLLDVARKYGKLTDSKLIVWLEEKLGAFVKTKDE